MILGYSRRPYADELLYGYIHDIFYKNGFSTMNDVDQLVGGHIRVGCTTALPVVCERIGNVTFPDVMQAVKMTPYGAYVNGLDAGAAARYAEMYLQAEMPYVPAHPSKEKDEIHICPECWKEDTERYGDGYLHLSHHLPGVTVCAKHGCTLFQRPVPLKRALMKPWTIKDMEPVESIDNIDEAVQYAQAQLRRNDENTSALVWSRCSRCGKEYVEHSYSRETACGCPFCNQTLRPETIVNRRLQTIQDGEYRVDPGFSALNNAYVIHEPCGSRKRKLMQVLYGEPEYCLECMKLTPERLKRRFDPSGVHWEFFENSETERQKKRIRVKHRVCGREFSIFSVRFGKKEGGYCPYCDNPQKVIDICTVDPEYRIVGEYKNNLLQVEMKHLACGTVFQTSKTSFLAGRRCPICTPRYDFKEVERAVMECAVGWTVRKEPRRGYVTLITPAGFVMSGLSYITVMNDLKSEKASIIKNRRKRWSDPVSIRRRIYDNVKKASLDKGFWCFADGLDGEPVSRTQRNLIQDLARLGYIERVGVGRYRTVTGNEEEI